MNFGLNQNEFNLLTKLVINPLKRHGAKLWVFGSRARGDHKKFSDIDLMYKISNPLPAGFLYDLKSNLEESNLPIKVDLVNEDEIAASYKNSAISERIEIL